MADPNAIFTPDQQALITQLLQQQATRAASTNPVHQAAQAMALRMAPGYAREAVTSDGLAGSPSGVGSFAGAPLSSPSGFPMGATLTASMFAALLKNPEFLAKIKGLLGGATGAKWEGPIEPDPGTRSGSNFPGGGAGGRGGGGTLEDRYGSIRGNPNAHLFDPLVGGSFSGFGNQDWSGMGANPNVQAF